MNGRCLARTAMGTRCTRSGVIQEGNAWYCAQHNPATVLARRDAAYETALANDHRKYDEAKELHRRAAAYEGLIAAMKQIREICYDSQAARATDTVLACIRVSEDAIIAAEKKPSL